MEHLKTIVDEIEYQGLKSVLQYEVRYFYREAGSNEAIKLGNVSSYNKKSAIHRDNEKG